MIRILPAAALLLAVPLCAGPAVNGDLSKQVTIYRDTYGVPHIYARTEPGAIFGMMYAQAEDNFWQIETDYIRAIGRAAEVEGPSALAHDVLVRAYEAQRNASNAYDQADGPFRNICDAFADGVNFYLENHPEVKPRLITHFEPWFILALEYAGPWTTMITREERERAFPVLKGAEPAQDPAPDPDEGSNMWAVAPSRTTTGHAMLLINPHVGFFGGGQRYEAHLHTEDGLDVSGFAILGTPYIRSGHNRYLGWSHTNNYAQTSDVYAERFDDPKDALSYHYGRSHRKAEEWTEEIAVKTANGVEKRSVVFRKTQHGPILGLRPANNGVVEQLAVHFAGAEGGIMQQRLAMAKAKNLKEFKEALGQLALTGSNTIYADSAGNIYYLHGNAIPKRSMKFDWSKPVDGSNAETDWDGKHALADLPQVLNPPSGWLQNCNSTPFLTTSGANPEPTKYPAYMAPEDDTERARRSRAILAGSGKFSFDDWAKAAMDTKIGLAAARLPEVQQAFAKLQQSDAARAEKLKDLVAELTAWDQVGRIDSVAATLFVRMETRAIELRRANPQDPLLLMSALEQARAALEADWGTWRVKWGDVNRLERIQSSGTLEPFRDDKPSVPVPGAPTFTGTIFTFGARHVEGQKRWYGTVGDTYVSVVEFGSHPDARSLLVFGESADPQSRHFFDQAELYSTQQFKPAWFDLADIRKHLEKSYRPGGK